MTHASRFPAILRITECATMNADLCEVCRDTEYALCADCLALERAKRYVETLFVVMHGWDSARVVEVSPHDEDGWRIVAECVAKNRGPVEIRNPNAPGVRVVPCDEFDRLWAKDTPNAHRTDLVRRMVQYVGRYDLPG